VFLQNSRVRLFCWFYELFFYWKSHGIGPQTHGSGPQWSVQGSTGCIKLEPSNLWSAAQIRRLKGYLEDLIVSVCCGTDGPQHSRWPAAHRRRCAIELTRSAMYVCYRAQFGIRSSPTEAVITGWWCAAASLRLGTSAIVLRCSKGRNWLGLMQMAAPPLPLMSRQLNRRWGMMYRWGDDDGLELGFASVSNEILASGGFLI
jgi:hypothetical protein